MIGLNEERLRLDGGDKGGAIAVEQGSNATAAGKLDIPPVNIGWHTAGQAPGQDEAGRACQLTLERRGHGATFPPRQLRAQGIEPELTFEGAGYDDIGPRSFADGDDHGVDALPLQAAGHFLAGGSAEGQEQAMPAA